MDGPLLPRSGVHALYPVPQKWGTRRFRPREPGRMPSNHAAFGPLAPLLADDRVTDVFLNPDGTVWVDRGGGARPDTALRVPPGEARELAVRLVASGGRHLDEATPCADVRIGDGLRVHGVLPPVSPGAAVLSIRVPRTEPLLLDRLERDGFF